MGLVNIVVNTFQHLLLKLVFYSPRVPQSLDSTLVVISFTRVFILFLIARFTFDVASPCNPTNGIRLRTNCHNVNSIWGNTPKRADSARKASICTPHNHVSHTSKLHCLAIDLKRRDIPKCSDGGLAIWCARNTYNLVSIHVLRQYHFPFKLATAN